MQRVSSPHLKEQTIAPLSIDDLKRLFSTAQQASHRACLPALGLMVYAGVRPEEIRRIGWHDIDWEEEILYMRATHSKTGGGRHIPLAPPLICLLRRLRRKGEICPPNWRIRWRNLRQEAGFATWVPDVLRHTFASYHAKMYKDLPLPQLAMGHRDCQLLLTRYINMRGLTRNDAQLFWKGMFLRQHI